MNFRAQTIRFVLYVLIVLSSVSLAVIGMYFPSLLLLNISVAAIFFERERTAMQAHFSNGHAYSYFRIWWKEYKRWANGFL